jgi:hypothetical protein
MKLTHHGVTKDRDDYFSKLRILRAGFYVVFSFQKDFPELFDIFGVAVAPDRIGREQFDSLKNSVQSLG